MSTITQVTWSKASLGCGEKQRCRSCHTPQYSSTKPLYLPYRTSPYRASPYRASPYRASPYLLAASLSINGNHNCASLTRSVCPAPLYSRIFRSHIYRTPHVATHSNLYYTPKVDYSLVTTCRLAIRNDFLS